MKGDQAALELLDEAQPILDYFRGVGNAAADDDDPRLIGWPT